MTNREKQMHDDPWVQENFCRGYSNYIDPSFDSGVDWADRNPDPETITKVVRLVMKGIGELMDGKSEFRSNVEEYIKAHWND